MVKDPRREALTDALFLGPAIFFFAIIVVGSFILGIYYAFTDWNGISLSSNWVGWENFRTIFTDDRQVGYSAVFTLRLTLTAVVLSNVLGLGLALLVTRAIKFANGFRAVFFLPNVIGGIILGFIWRFIFTSAFPALGDLTGWGFFELPWLGDAFTGFWAIIIVFTWRTTGYLMVIYIAAIMAIDDALIESAQIDGASGVQMFLKITLPLIAPAVTICLFLMLSWSTKIFDVIFSLTRGGPFGATEAFALNIYFEAFQANNYGLGSAKAVLFFLVVGVVTLIQVTLTKRLEIDS